MTCPNKCEYFRTTWIGEKAVCFECGFYLLGDSTEAYKYAHVPTDWESKNKE